MSKTARPQSCHLLLMQTSTPPHRGQSKRVLTTLFLAKQQHTNSMVESVFRFSLWLTRINSRKLLLWFYMQKSKMIHCIKGTVFPLNTQLKTFSLFTCLIICLTFTTNSSWLHPAAKSRFRGYT